MAEPARVLYQSGGSGFVVFAGQTVPAAALNVGELYRLHELARTAMQAAKDIRAVPDTLGAPLQELHLELADLLLRLQDAANRNGVDYPNRCRVDSKEFVTFGEAG